ncbi:unnamed protein product [Effrenium voratum]|uniref:Uncharacterized protein n=1 Tax=Effrenium voratum TaxID=2562239 RepID=A0AA36N6E6_9DINO|nr:unnamed protein product [Effrenium voratum]
MVDTIGNLLRSLRLLEETGSARFSGYDGEEAERTIWTNYAEALQWPWWVSTDCPFADLMLRLCLWSACLLSDNSHQSCEQFSAKPILLSRDLLGHDGSHWALRSWEQLYVFLNTRFAAFFSDWARRMRLLAAWKLSREDYPGLDCEGDGLWPSGWDWAGHLERISTNDPNQFYEPGREDREAEGAVDFSMNPAAFVNIEQKVRECPVGMLAMLSHQVLLGLNSVSEQAPLTLFLLVKAADMVEQALPDLLPRLLLSRWPVLPFLSAAALVVQWRSSWQIAPRYQNKPYLLDFRPEELILPLEEQQQLPVPQQQMCP